MVVFGLFLVINGAYLHRVPGLMGDEASEGENVYEKLSVLTDDETGVSEEVLITGERSYIGPLIDYMRMPFVWMFGYTALALRVLILLISIATFWLAWSVLTAQFERWPALFGLVFLTFSPVYILYQRLGWGITLFPFFAFLIIWLAQRDWKHKWLLVGFTGGLGLANHIIFLPTLVGIAVGLVVYAILQRFSPKRLTWKSYLNVWPGLVGFLAGFGTQFVILLLDKQGDQGNPDATILLFGERVSSWLEYFPLYVSGSSYVARYIGSGFSQGFMLFISYGLLALGFLSIVLLWRKKAVWVWLLGLMAHLVALFYIIDRFTLRYFVVIALGAWLMAGLGIGAGFEKIFQKKERMLSVAGISLAVLLTLWMIAVVFVPFLRSGGSVNDFSLGDRTNSAAALVDVRGLVDCLRGAGSVHSENVHILNRLQYASHEYGDLDVLTDEEMDKAQWVVHYRQEGVPGGVTPGDLCPELTHFRVVKK